MLRQTHFGRVAISTPKGPHIAPVRYAVVEIGDRPVIVMRTTPYSLLASQPERGSMTLEIDNVNEHHDTGWTVSACGRCETVRNEKEREVIESSWPDGADGGRSIFVKLAWTELSGRWLGPLRATTAGRR